MDQNYKEALSIAKGLENDIKNWLDDKTHPAGRGLLDQSRQLVSQVSAKREPRSLEDQVKALLNLLEQAKAEDDAVMDQQHISSLRRGYEELILSLRKF